MSMILGRENYVSSQGQVGLKRKVLEEVSKIVIDAWKRFTPVLAGIKQK